jgi:hypothetical protein
MAKQNKPSRHAAWFDTANCREVQQRRFLADFAQWHYEWLREIGRQWKERGEYALDRFSLMDYYDDAGDIETAGYVSLLTQDNARLHDQITELRNIIGPNPWRWMKERRFIILAEPSRMNQRLLGTNHTMADIYNVMDWLWHHFGGDGGADYGLDEVVRIQEPVYAMDMLSMRLSKTDGIGCGVYQKMDDCLTCPINRDMLRLIRTYYPLGGVPGTKQVDANTADDVLSFMGYDDTTEFVYTYQGYRNMQLLMPEAMERNEKLFLKRFREGNMLDTMHHSVQEMRKIIPEIRFE